MRKICVLTGSRAEYGYLRNLLSILKSKSNLKLIVTGMHLSSQFGLTIKEIEKDGYKIDEIVDMHTTGDAPFDMARSIGKGIIGITEALAKIQPDILVVFGDRTEALAGAISAVYMNIFVAHINGGDKSKAGLDESARHAISKLAHIHFPSTKENAKRLIRMGEINVYPVGSLSLERIHDTYSRNELEKRLKIKLTKPSILVVQHPVTTSSESAESQMISTLEAVKEYYPIVIYPNSDAGGRAMIKMIKKYDYPAFKSLSQKEYFSLLSYVDVLVGNSSSGIIEAASFKLPVVNIGSRQEGRQTTINVIHTQKVVGGIEIGLSEGFKKRINKCKNPYEKAHSSHRIASMLCSAKLDIQKQIAY